MSAYTVQIELPVRTMEIVRALAPDRLLPAIARGMDTALDLTLSDIKRNRLTGRGPFPVEEGRLGVRSGELRKSAYRVPAAISGSTVTGAIGSPLKYAGIHEFGGEIHRTVKPGKVRLRTNRDGTLVRRGDLATFARKRHKLVREVPYEGGKEYTIRMPARAPFGRGIADNEELIVREIGAALTAEMEGGTTP